ncbi:MAG: sigma-70 family RNA polymerase sigma factor [Candidatus Dormibacteraeota bacterium]|nr:sigma-70 family RNA polymerase sigma factor [Candidatus Dormibacteraeota bacterium]
MEGRPLEESQLVDRARAGDVNAYEQLVERYSTVSFRTAYLIAQSEADAEDACQEAFVKAFRALSRFRPGASFRPWILQIVANEARNARRAVGRRFDLSLRVAEQVGTGGAAPSPERLAEATEEREQLLRAVNTLRHEDRLVVACRYFLDLSSEETAAVLGWPEGTVKSRLSRALDRLREQLGGRDG